MREISTRLNDQGITHYKGRHIVSFQSCLLATDLVSIIAHTYTLIQERQLRHLQNYTDDHQWSQTNLQAICSQKSMYTIHQLNVCIRNMKYLQWSIFSNQK